MESRVSYALAGVFVLTLGAAAVAVLLWLAAGGPRHGFTRYLVVMHESVWALPPDAAVRYSGVKVGRVESIRLDPQDPQQVRILLDIYDGTPINTDTHATLQMQGITGIAFVSLSGGSVNARPLTRKPGQPYPVIPSEPSLMQRLDVILTEVGKSLNQVSQRLDFLLSESNMQHLSATLAHLDTISGTLATNSSRIGATLISFDATLKEIRHSAVQLPALIDNANRSIAGLPPLIARLNRSAHRFDLAASKVGAAAIAVQGALPRLNSTLRRLGDAADVYRRLGEQLQSNPSSLLLGAPTPQPGPGEHP